MIRLEVRGAVGPIYGSLGVKRLTHLNIKHQDCQTNARRYADGLRVLQGQNK